MKTTICLTESPETCDLKNEFRLLSEREIELREWVRFGSIAEPALDAIRRRKEAIAGQISKINQDSK